MPYFWKDCIVYAANWYRSLKSGEGFRDSGCHIMSDRVFDLSKLDSGEDNALVFLDDTIVKSNEKGGTQGGLYVDNLKEGWHYLSKRSTSGNEENGVFIMIPPNNMPPAIIEKKVIVEARKENNDKKLKYNDVFFVDCDFENTKYNYYKDYWRMGELVNKSSHSRKHDQQGIPMVCYYRNLYVEYNATIVTHYALGKYKEDMETGSEDFKIMLKYVDWLLLNMHADGSYRCNVPTPYRNNIIPRGYASGMTCGQVLSALARIFYLTKDETYIVKGNRVLDFMLTNYDGSSGTLQEISDFTDISDSFKNYRNLRLPEELPYKHKTHILNGDLFALLGLYDWHCITEHSEHGKKARALFEEGLKAISLMLPYYDFYGYSAYDIMHYTGSNKANFTSGYAHAWHVVLLKALYDVTGDKQFQYYYKLFKKYNDDNFFMQSELLWRKGE